MFIICEKSYIERLGKLIDDEINLYDSDNVAGIQNFFYI